MTDLFFKDSINNQIITWEFLIKDINSSLNYNLYCKSANYYHVFRHIIISLIIDREVILLDSDFSDSELLNLTEQSEFEKFSESIKREDIPFIQDKDDLINGLRANRNNWRITLFTSGSTGRPKKITHTYESITRFVIGSDKNRNSTWGFAYNPTHMAGIQVFFQALLNGNPLVRLFGLSPLATLAQINENAITHISATPTFYRLLLPYTHKSADPMASSYQRPNSNPTCHTHTFSSVKRITSGGEKFNDRTVMQLRSIFPNAKITNVYASTEAGALFGSDSDVFTVKPAHKNLIRVENDELLIHISLIGTSDVNIDEWYRTGDLIEVTAQDPLTFRFISRLSDMINVGGYKVNPLEVEEAILTLTGIIDVRVYPKSNSVLGNIICCEVVCDEREISEPLIRAFLKSKMQEFKIPRIIRFVDELQTTRTGKISRVLV